MRCEFDIENERRELNARSGSCTQDHAEDEVLASMPKKTLAPNGGEEFFRKLNIAVMNEFKKYGVNHG